MVEEKDQEMQEVIEEFADDLAYDEKGEPMQGPGEKSKAHKKGRLVFMVGILFLIIILAGAYVLLKGFDRYPDEQLTEIQSKLAPFEMRIIRLERTVDKVSALEKQGREIQELIDKKVQKTAALSKRLAELTQRLDNLTKKAPLTKAATKPSPPAQADTPAQVEKQYHQVERGETLYQIGKKYGLTVKQLRQINQLDSYQFIQPGQKLLVSPIEPQ